MFSLFRSICSFHFHLFTGIIPIISNCEIKPDKMSTMVTNTTVCSHLPGRGQCNLFVAT